MRGTKLLFFGFLWIAASVFVLAACGAPEDVSSPEEQPLLSGETAEDESTANSALSAEETLLSQKLQALGLTPEDVPGSQLLVVLPDGSSATICRFELKGVSWVQQGEGIPAYVGNNGVSAGKREGDGTTPAGLFPVGPAFGLEENPRTNLDYRTVTTDSYWVDDPDSVFYNQWVEGTVQKDWSHAERLCDYPQQYALGLVIAYNTDPIVPGLGSAIFLHCGKNPTLGCIAVAHEDMEGILGWLDPANSPSILICNP